MPQIDIVLPCYNPVGNWHHTVVEQFELLSKAVSGDVQLHLIVVNDGSTKNIDEDNISYIKSSIKDFTYLSYPMNHGKGYALRYGVSHSLAEYCIYTDIDFPYSTQSIFKVVQELLKGKHIVAGNRSDEYYMNMPKSRIYISKILKTVIKGLLGLRFTDTQCGLKGFNSKGKKLFLSTTINRYLFDLEFIYLASQSKDITMQPVDVELRDNIIFSKMNTKVLWSESINFLKLFFKRML